MPCGAIVYFDQETDAALRGLWQVIEDAGLPSAMLSLTYPPHLTLMMCDELGMDGLGVDVKQFLADHPPLPVTFSGFGVFPGELGVVYMAVTPKRDLLDFHAALWDIARPHLQPGNSYYQPDTWVPHVTLGYDLDPALTGAAVTALARAHWPRQGLLRELVLAGFTIGSDGMGATSYTEVFKARLGSF